MSTRRMFPRVFLEGQEALEFCISVYRDVFSVCDLFRCSAVEALNDQAYKPQIYFTAAVMFLLPGLFRARVRRFVLRDVFFQRIVSSLKKVRFLFARYETGCQVN